MRYGIWLLLIALVAWLVTGMKHPLRILLGKHRYTEWVVGQMGTVDEINAEARQIFAKYNAQPAKWQSLHKYEPLCRRLCSLGGVVQYTRMYLAAPDGMPPSIQVDYHADWASEVIVIFDPDWRGEIPVVRTARPFVQIEDNIYYSPVPGRSWGGIE